MTTSTSQIPHYMGPWYVYHRDEDGSETDHIFYNYIEAQERFAELEDRGFFEALTLTTQQTLIEPRAEEDEEVPLSGGNCLGYIVIFLVVIALIIGAFNGIRL